jgi:sigma-B regulation protein RsbU (phosphoserine phosphatase)
VLEAVNRALCDGNEAGMFVTLFCGVLEIDSGKFSFANAGHNPPLLLGADGSCDFFKLKKGLVAGIIESTRYPLDSRQLVPGDSVLLYTDGVTEALNHAEELYTEQRFLDAVREKTWQDPRGLVDCVHAGITGFVRAAPQADDITMLAVRYCSSTVAPPQPADVLEDN